VRISLRLATHGSIVAFLALSVLAASDASASCGYGISAEFCIDTTAASSVEAALQVTITEEGHVALRWSVGSLTGVAGFNVHRARSQGGPFARLNDVPLAPCSPCDFEDSTAWPDTEFWYRLSAVTDDGEENILGAPIAVRTGGVLSFRLGEARPNPTSAGTSVALDVGQDAGSVRLAVYDVSGRLVRALVDGPRARGRYVEHWDGCGTFGRPAVPGVYFIKASAVGWVGASKVVLVR
jgi:hypothetical protein